MVQRLPQAFITLLFTSSCLSIQVQWELQVPQGSSPDAVFGSATCINQNMRGMPLLFGGLVLDSEGSIAPRVVGGCEDDKCTQGTINIFDKPAYGWETIRISSNPYPQGRAGHTLTGTTTKSLMCGGFTTAEMTSAPAKSRENLYGIVSTNVLSASDLVSIDCWWLSVIPKAGWTRVVNSSNIAPIARAWHAAAWDNSGNNVVVFGGQDSSGMALSDCWYLQVSDASGMAGTAWASCDPAGGAGLQPPPRYGHIALWYSQGRKFFVFGGFGVVEAEGNQLLFALNDVWILDKYSTTDRVWAEVEPTTKRPPARAFHAAWPLGDFKMVVHGGESKKGFGPSSILSDTWRFDFLTSAWTMYPPDSNAPPRLHAAAVHVSAATAVLFGGVDDQRRSSGSVMVFDSGVGWRKVIIAGSRPSRRSGHLMTMLNNEDGKALVSHGASWDGKLLNDTWLLDFVQGTQAKWTCLQGDSCPSSGPAARLPPPTAFAAHCKVGNRLFTFGGASSLAPMASHNQAWTAALGVVPPAWSPMDFDAVVATHPYPTNDSEAYDGSKARAYSASARPMPRTHASALAIAPLRGFSKPVLLLGGLSPEETEPLDDIWIIDSNDQVSGENTGSWMLSFDGTEDLLSIPLPSFLQSTRGLGALWVEAWMLLDVPFGFQNMVLLDLQDVDGVAAFRLTISSSQSGYSADLIFYPTDITAAVTIKTWSPINTDSFTSAWHHFALTLRFARLNRPGSSDPDVCAAQAFFFVDGEPVADDGGFVNMDITSRLVLRKGLSVLFVGGPFDTRELLRDYSSFSGNLDAIRVWAPTCPPGPTMCNPFGFLDPMNPALRGKTVSGIQDGVGVRLVDVAEPLLRSMFSASLDPNTPGLVVSLSAADSKDGKLNDKSLWLPGLCGAGNLSTCDQCDSSCSFSRCPTFDVDCMASRGSALANLQFYAINGTCNCLDATSCPKQVASCTCPSQTMIRTCTACSVLKIDGVNRVRTVSRNLDTCAKEVAKGNLDICLSWSCICDSSKGYRRTCMDCSLNGRRLPGSEPCLRPSICSKYECTMPFSYFADNDPQDFLLNRFELLSIVDSAIKKFASTSLSTIESDLLNSQALASCFSSAITQKGTVSPLAVVFTTNLLCMGRDYNNRILDSNEDNLQGATWAGLSINQVLLLLFSDINQDQALDETEAHASFVSYDDYLQYIDPPLPRTDIARLRKAALLQPVYKCSELWDKTKNWRGLAATARKNDTDFCNAQVPLDYNEIPYSQQGSPITPIQLFFHIFSYYDATRTTIRYDELVNSILNQEIVNAIQHYNVAFGDGRHASFTQEGFESGIMYTFVFARHRESTMQFNEFYELNLQPSTDSFDQFLLDYDSLFGSGSGQISTDQMMRAFDSDFLMWSQLMLELASVPLRDVLLQYEAMVGCRPRWLCRGNADGRVSEYKAYFAEYFEVPLQGTDYAGQHNDVPSWLAGALRPGTTPTFLMVYLLTRATILVDLSPYCATPDECLYQAGFGYDSRRVRPAYAPSEDGDCMTAVHMVTDYVTQNMDDWYYPGYGASLGTRFSEYLSNGQASCFCRTDYGNNEDTTYTIKCFDTSCNLQCTGSACAFTNRSVEFTGSLNLIFPFYQLGWDYTDMVTVNKLTCSYFWGATWWLRSPLAADTIMPKWFFDQSYYYSFDPRSQVIVSGAAAASAIKGNPARPSRVRAWSFSSDGTTPAWCSDQGDMDACLGRMIDGDLSSSVGIGVQNYYYYSQIVLEYSEAVTPTQFFIKMVDDADDQYDSWMWYQQVQIMNTECRCVDPNDPCWYNVGSFGWDWMAYYYGGDGCWPSSTDLWGYYLSLDLMSRYANGRVSDLQVFELASMPSSTRFSIILPSMYLPLISEIGFRNDTLSGSSCGEGQWAEESYWDKRQVAGDMNYWIYDASSLTYQYSMNIYQNERANVRWKSDSSIGGWGWCAAIGVKDWYSGGDNGGGGSGSGSSCDGMWSSCGGDNNSTDTNETSEGVNSGSGGRRSGSERPTDSHAKQQDHILEPRKDWRSTAGIVGWAPPASGDPPASPIVPRGPEGKRLDGPTPPWELATGDSLNSAAGRGPPLPSPPEAFSSVPKHAEQPPPAKASHAESMGSVEMMRESARKKSAKPIRQVGKTAKSEAGGVVRDGFPEPGLEDLKRKKGSSLRAVAAALGALKKSKGKLPADATLTRHEALKTISKADTNSEGKEAAGQEKERDAAKDAERQLQFEQHRMVESWAAKLREVADDALVVHRERQRKQVGVKAATHVAEASLRALVRPADDFASAEWSVRATQTWATAFTCTNCPLLKGLACAAGSGQASMPSSDQLFASVDNSTYGGASVCTLFLPQESLLNGTSLCAIDQAFASSAASTASVVRLAELSTVAAASIGAPPVDTQQNAARLQAVMRIQVDGSRVLPAAKAEVAIGMDPCVQRQSSGCTSIINGKVVVCAPGAASMQYYDSAAESWVSVSGVEKRCSGGSVCSDTMPCNDYLLLGNCTKDPSRCPALQSLVHNTTTLHEWWRVTSRPKCCIYRGNGRACGDRICLAAAANPNSAFNPGLLGDGIPSRSPSVVRSARPAWSSAGQYSEYLRKVSDRSYVPATGWLQVCPTGLRNQAVCPESGVLVKQTGINWPRGRFGMAVASLKGADPDQGGGGVRVVLYGGWVCSAGIACSTFVASDDAWELYLPFEPDAAYAPMLLTTLNPVGLPRQAGWLGVSLEDDSTTFWTFGGTSGMPQSLVGQLGYNGSNASYSLREGRFNTRDVDVRKLLVTEYVGVIQPEVSEFAMANNYTIAVAFGGFFINSHTSAVFYSDYNAPTGDSSYVNLVAVADRPGSRLRAHVLVFAASLLLFGGSTGIRGLMEARTDRWLYGLRSGEWIQQEREGPAVVFAASGQVSVGDSYALLLSGGVRSSFTSVAASSLSAPYISTPFPRFDTLARKATGEFRALFTSSNCGAGTDGCGWVRIRPLNWDPLRCLSLEQICESVGQADYWSCYSQTQPYWYGVTVPRVGLACNWASASSKDSSCQVSTDPLTMSCTIPLPPTMTCEMGPRFMHSMTVGNFPVSSAVMYGGYDAFGRLSSDVWVYDVSSMQVPAINCTQCGFLVSMNFSAHWTAFQGLSCLNDTAYAFQKLVADLLGQNDPATVQYEIMELPRSVLAKPFCLYTCMGDGATDSVWNSTVPAVASAVLGGTSNGTNGTNASSTSGSNATNGTSTRPTTATATWVWTGPTFFSFIVRVSVTDPAGLWRAYNNQTTPPPQTPLPITAKGLTGLTLLRVSTVAGVGQENQPLTECAQKQRTKDDFVKACIGFREARADARQLDSSLGCESGCVISYCQFRNQSRYGDFSGLINCDQPGVCADDGVCGAPGARSGHATTSFTFQGISLLLIFGGEVRITDEAGFSSLNLSNTVYVGLFQDSSMTSSQLFISQSSPVPVPRRDASVAMIDQTTGLGKMLMFGGLTGAEGRGSYGGDFLTGKYEGLTSLDDLWYLDLDQLGMSVSKCLSSGICPPISWRFISVAGTRPMSRFGATLMLLDESGQGELYINGGVHLDSSVSPADVQELDDLFRFDLRAPLHEACAATGPALNSMVAGQPSSFFVACADVFDQPAKGGQFTVSIRAAQQCASCPTLFPTVSETSVVGLFKCTFIVEYAGIYSVTINVGSGGSTDLVSGDPFSTSSPDIESIKAALREGNGRTDFTLTVEAAGTYNPSSVVVGSMLTLSTAGVSSSFFVKGQDKFANRVAGGDDVSAVLTSLDLGITVPNQVTDNQDGTYACSYMTSQAGNYMVQVVLNGLDLGGSPYSLVVMALGASVDMTYAYGSFINTKTGFTFTVFVQTRDMYGNYLTSNSETIKFESCSIFGDGCAADDDNCVCGGGAMNPDVSIDVAYGIGPNVTATYNGIYKITYYLFSPGAFQSVVKHNTTYIGCYFDQGNSTDTTLWTDPIAAADKCTQYNRLQKTKNAVARRKLLKSMKKCDKSANASADAPNDCEEIRRALDGADLGGRRAITGAAQFFDPVTGQPTPATPSLTLPTFVRPDRGSARYWIITAPIICAGLAAAFLIIPYILRFVWGVVSPPPTSEMDKSTASQLNAMRDGNVSPTPRSPTAAAADSPPVLRFLPSETSQEIRGSS